MGCVPDRMRWATGTRIADTGAWNAWLSQVAGHPAAELEMVQRTLRVRDVGPQARTVDAVRRFTGGDSARTAATRAPAHRGRGEARSSTARRRATR